jgi:hypothetical protein
MEAVTDAYKILDLKSWRDEAIFKIEAYMEAWCSDAL